MKREEVYTTWIGPYLDDKLSTEEKEEFEGFLATPKGESLQEKLDAEVASRNFMQLVERKRLKEKFIKLDQARDKKKITKLSPFLTLAIAASAALMLLSILYFNKVSQNSSDVFMAEILEESLKEERSNNMKGEKSVPNDLDLAEELLKANDCVGLEKLVQTARIKNHPEFLLGICYIRNKDYESALQIFEQKASLHAKKAFYTGYIYSQQQDTLAACLEFQKVVNAEGRLDKLKEAQAMLVRLSCQTQ